MRRRPPALTFAFTIFLLLSAPILGSAAPGEPGLRIVDQAWIRATAANDLEGIMALYAPDARLYPPDAMEAKGKDAIRASWKGFLDAMTIKEVRLFDETYETAGDLSAGAVRWSLVAVPRAGGPPVTMEGRATAVAKRIDGTWLYIIDHASMPPPPPPEAAPPSKGPSKAKSKS